MNMIEAKMIYRLIIFLLINLGALAIGGFFTGKGVQSDWYKVLEKAPWTPPGWVFGFAWTTIMICFSVYMAYLWPVIENKNLLVALFIVQWIMNVGWNPTFFYYHNILAGLFLIIGLTFLIGFFQFFYWPELKLKSIFILPYFIWLMIATSLNGYIQIKN
jgi:benzodiazapine receptor